MSYHGHVTGALLPKIHTSVFMNFEKIKILIQAHSQEIRLLIFRYAANPSATFLHIRWCLMTPEEVQGHPVMYILTYCTI